MASIKEIPTRKRSRHGGSRPGAGRKPGRRKASIKLTLHYGLIEAAKKHAPLVSHNLSSLVEAALAEKLRAGGIAVERILSQPPVLR